MTDQDMQYSLLNFGIPANEANELLKISRLVKVDRDAYYLANGQIPKKIAFNLKGLFRYVYGDDKGNEFTKSIIPENSILASYSAMLYQAPSFFAIQALEDSQVLETPYQDWLLLKSTNRFWDLFLIRMLEKGFCIKEKRERDLLLLDAETRYKNFLTEFPGLENRLTQQIVASYLGIKPESLSRIRKKIAG
jgi:CRP-like cAMP-binding protein